MLLFLNIFKKEINHRMGDFVWGNYKNFYSADVMVVSNYK